MPRRPPPSPGNRHGMTHGGLATPSPIELEPLEREIFEALAADAPVKDADGTLPAADRAVVSLLAQTWWRLQNVRTWLDEHGEVHTRRYTSDDPKQKRRRERAKRKRRAYDPMRVVELEAKLRREAADYLDALGMTPRSRAKLNLDQARSFDLAKEWEEQDRAKRRRGSIEGEARDA